MHTHASHTAGYQKEKERGEGQKRHGGEPSKERGKIWVSDHGQRQQETLGEDLFMALFSTRREGNKSSHMYRRWPNRVIFRVSVLLQKPEDSYVLHA